MVTRKPSVWVAHLVVLGNMELIGGKDVCPVLFEIDLHYAQAGGVTGRMVEGDTLKQIKVRIVEGLPIECFERHIVGHIHTEIGPCGYCPAGMFEFFFVDVDWDI